MKNKIRHSDSAPANGGQLAMGGEQQWDEAIFEGESLFRSFFDNATVGMVQVDIATGRYLHANPSHCRTTGYSRAELLEKTFLEITHPDDRAANWIAFQAAVRDGGNKAFSIEKRIIRKDGATIWVRVSAGLVRDEQGKPVRTAAVVEDISDRKRVEAALRESEERLRLATKATGLTIWEWDIPAGIVHYLDNGDLDEHGIPKEACNDVQTMRRLVHPDDVDMIRQLDEAVRDHHDFESEYRIICPDGQIRWRSNHARPYYDEAGKPLRAIGTVADITDRKRAELNAQFVAAVQSDLLRLSSAEEIMNEVGERISRYFDASRVTYSNVNEDADELDSIYDKHQPDLISGLGVHRLCEFVGERYLNDLRSGKTVAINDFMSDPHTAPTSGAYERYGVRAGVIIPYLSDGRWRFTLCIHRREPHVWRPDEIEVLGELTSRIYMRLERVRTEERLRVSEARLSAIFAGAAVGLSEISLDGRFLQVNDALCRMLGRSAEALLAVGVSDVTHPDDRSRTLTAIRSVVETGEQASLDKRYVRDDGTTVWANSSLARLDDEHGKPRSVLVVTMDLSERKQFADERERLLAREQRARQQAERATKTKDEFLAVVSHELRTPLTAILLWAKMLRSGSVPAERHREVFETIERAATSQQQLIEDLLDISRMMSGNLRLHIQETELVPIVGAAVDAVRPQADAKGVRLCMSLDVRTGHLRVDPDRVQQIVWNLVSNAVKFTPKGGQVSIALGRLGDVMEIQVIDTGRGISDDFLPHVFDRFRQADPSTTRLQGGLGLGLAISRQLVELHGGRIRAESDGEGRGAKFTVELPIRAVSDQQADEQAPSAPAIKYAAQAKLPRVLDGLRILLVEDEPNTRAALRWALERGGGMVVAVESAAEAMAAYRQSIGNHRFSAIVSDIGMPGMDGYQLIRNLRMIERESGDAEPLPAMALTAFTRDEDRADALAAGFQTHVSKPVKPEDLIHAVAELTGHDGR